jgi:hypothetical protein
MMMYEEVDGTTSTGGKAGFTGFLDPQTTAKQREMKCVNE